MKISFNWLQDYLELEQSPEELSDILTEIGLEVEGMEMQETVKGGLEGVVVGEVLSCGKHPNADRLSLTEVNIGLPENVQIVCGAPNVAAGQKVAVATIGTTLYTENGKSWKIKKGKIRGEISQGMICAEDELGLGSNHDGIMVLNAKATPGTPAREYFEISSDIIYDIGLTPNRSDATSHVGVAKDLVAALQINYGHNGKIRLPEVDTWQIDQKNLPVEVEVKDFEACPRYAGVSIDGITVSESPKWLQDKLFSVGVRPINNIVDATNFVLHELGQPLHAFDLDQISDQTIRVKALPEGTEFISLDEQTRRLSDGDLMICDGQDKGMCIAGVFGGIASGVTAKTQRIFLESAHFDSKWIRRTSTRHLLFSDAAKVFEKGSDPNICVFALKRAALLIKELAGGIIASEIVDIYPNPVTPKTIRLSSERLNNLVGTDIPEERVIEILSAMAMDVKRVEKKFLEVKVPTDKSDVTREADLIEEVLRVYGYNRVPVPSRMHFAINTTNRPDPTLIRNRIADHLASIGFQEMMNMSMVDKKYAEEIFNLDGDKLVRINNTSNVQVEVMRPEMLMSVLEAIRHNQHRQQSNLRLFEFGKSYSKADGAYLESYKLAVALEGWVKESWLIPSLEASHEYFILKSVAEQVMALLGIDTKAAKKTRNSYLQDGLDYLHKDHVIASLGIVRSTLVKGMNAKGTIHYLEFDWDEVMKIVNIDNVTVKPISKFPSVRRDLSLVVNKNVTFNAIKDIVIKQGGALLASIDLFDVYTDTSVLGDDTKSYAISMTFRDKHKTLSDKGVDVMIKRISDRLNEQLGAKLR
ncbi:MAG: phenylalanine--tRNA ligase subunit beta [Saprospiraceae bacterium]|nr:phenylalanine--tRNA ligase subunit beta [Saprospiraceae bacterium]